MRPVHVEDRKGLAEALSTTRALLATAPPQADGCPALNALVPALASAGAFPDWTGYLSTTGVYGDRRGRWVTEKSRLAAQSVEGARRVQQLGDRKVRGRVVRAGSHDELGGAQYVIVRDDQGTEHYARLAFGRTAPKVGAQVELAPGPKGAQLLGLGRPGPDRGL